MKCIVRPRGDAVLNSLGVPPLGGPEPRQRGTPNFKLGHCRPRAWLDLEETIKYLRDQAGEETALRFWQRAQDTFASLTQQPGVGRPRPDLRPDGLHSWRVSEFENWLVFYAVEEENLIVYRVRSGLMDLIRLELRS